MLRVGDITLVMLLILLIPALFGSHCDAFHRSFTLYLEGGYQVQGITYIWSGSGAETPGGLNAKKLLFLMSYLIFEFPLDLALWGAKLEVSPTQFLLRSHVRTTRSFCRFRENYC